MNGCNITIIDTSPPEDCKIGEVIEEEIQKANVLLLLFDITCIETINRISEFWLKELSKLTKSPIILLANKIDCKEENEDYSFDRIVKTLTDKKLTFESIFECSSSTLEGILEVFIFMQKVVIYPTAPLLDSSKNELTEAFQLALRLVFRRVDRDKDFHLSVEEVRNMQIEVFNHEISADGILAIFSSVEAFCPESVDEKGLNFKGFCAMQLLMIHKLNADACWKLIFYYGFNQNLTLSADYSEVLQKSHGLSKDSIIFLVSLFDQFSYSGNLDQSSLQKVFETCSCTPHNKDIKKIFFEFKERVETEYDMINLYSWLSYWVLLAAQDRQTCCKFLFYLGYSKSVSDMWADSKNVSVSQAFVIGVNGVGKTWLLNTLIRRKQNKYLPTSSIKSVSACIVQSPVPWLNEFLILTEIPLIEAEEKIQALDNDENLIVLVNENIESQVCINKLGLKQFKNLVVLNNHHQSLEESNSLKDLQNFPNFIKSAPKPIEPARPPRKLISLYLLAFVVIIFSIALTTLT